MAALRSTSRHQQQPAAQPVSRTRSVFVFWCLVFPAFYHTVSIDAIVAIYWLDAICYLRLLLGLEIVTAECWDSSGYDLL
jgi:hypothetical protein